MTDSRTFRGPGPEEWQDRVADAFDRPCAGRDDIRRIVAEAMEFAQTIVECSVVPLKDLLRGLASNVDFGDWPQAPAGDDDERKD